MSAARNSSQQSPRRQRQLNRPGTLALPSADTTPTCASTSGWIRSWETVGEPSVTMPSTRSGRRTASARANTPPRLWPTIETFRPAGSAKPSRRASSRAQASSEQPTLARIPARRVW